MKKRIFGMLLMGAMVVASMSTFTSCKDYDDDIKDLRALIDQNKKAIEQINTQVTQGAIVNSVTKTDDGIAIALSNGQNYTITNGTDGKDGKDGKDGTPGTVITIGDDGYWYIDGVKTDMKAKGEDGKDGKDGQDGKDGLNGKDGKNGKNGQDGKNGANGQNGKDGQNGADGKDGIYYEPGTEGAEAGYWVKVDPNTGAREVTNISWYGSGVTAIVNPDEGNVTVVTPTPDYDFDEGAKARLADGTTVIYNYVMLGNGLRGLVFEKDDLGRVYVDGVPGIRVASFNFSTLKVGGKETSGEEWTNDGKGVINPATYAYYHVNPTTCNINDLRRLSFVVKKNADYYSTTRTGASNDFDAKAEFVEFRNGILKVKVDVTGTPATAEKISVAALQATKKFKEKDAADEVVTSDYTCFFNYDMNAMRFVNKKEKIIVAGEDHLYHFRRMIINDNKKDDKNGLYQPARIKNKKVWDTKDLSDYDITLKWNDIDGKDLNDYVGVHNYDDKAAEDATSKSYANPCTNKEADLKTLGLKIDYEVVNGYKIGENNTNQADFITLKGSKIVARTYSVGQGSSAVGKTPVIRALLKDASDKTIEVAYIKVLITQDEEEDEDNEITLRYTNGVKYSCDAPAWNSYTVEEINTQLYNVLLEDRGVTREKFMDKYTLSADSKDRGNVIKKGYNNIGEVEEVKDEKGSYQGSTHIIKWRFTNAELWANAGKDVHHYIKYEAENSTIIVDLVTKIADVNKEYDIVKAKYISEYWNDDLSVAYFNVDVPTSTSDKDDKNCLFENDTNSPFVTYEKGDAQGRDGILVVDDYVTSIKYFFHKNNAGKRNIGGKDYTFTLKKDNTELWIGEEEIARIDNSGAYKNTTDTQLPNVIILNKESDLAKKLLNTEEFQVFIMAKGYICDAEDQEVKITFMKKDFYTAQYVRPIKFKDTAEKPFIDGVDFGEEGSYINIKNIVRPVDWRNREFSKYNNYWGYYGPFKVKFDNTKETAQIKLNGTWQAVPATIDVNYADPGTFKGGNDEYGYITYKNNGTTLNQPTEMKVRVQVTYGWGTIMTPWITVKVNTISAQD